MLGRDGGRRRSFPRDYPSFSPPPLPSLAAPSLTGNVLAKASSENQLHNRWMRDAVERRVQRALPKAALRRMKEQHRIPFSLEVFDADVLVERLLRSFDDFAKGQDPEERAFHFFKEVYALGGSTNNRITEYEFTHVMCNKQPTKFVVNKQQSSSSMAGIASHKRRFSWGRSRSSRLGSFVDDGAEERLTTSVFSYIDTRTESQVSRHNRFRAHSQAKNETNKLSP